jgi:hypothetical protein
VIDINYLIPFLTLLLGGLIGNRFALGRDKRKEHNSVIRPLKQKVLEYIDSLKSSKHQSLTESDIKVLRGIVSEKKYAVIKELHNDLVNLLRTHGKINNVGYTVYSPQGNIEISNKLNEINLKLLLK